MDFTVLRCHKAGVRISWQVHILKHPIDATPPSIPDDTRFPGLAVLIADDNQINLLILSAFLTGLGCTVHSVENGQEAVDQWEPGRFDLVFLDITMPVLDGIGALRALHAKAVALGATRPIIIAVTANPLSSLSHLSGDETFDGQMAKPIRRAGLIAEIRRLCPGRERP
jgi:CheY-like chemotaxis protein